jgi:large subunit ribosomal protein L34
MATKLKQKRRSGFLARKRSKTGRKILKRRRNKGRKKLSV